ncbi:MAG TPA: sugar transferase [Acidimicrobiales bacterium]|jgi:exopolysaccharide biosynthesis polyprenyl glycosylphosphotransferase|nr:sugar transferase [Acidimicrobiales bacterium]
MEAVSAPEQVAVPTLPSVERLLAKAAIVRHRPRSARLARGAVMVADVITVAASMLVAFAVTRVLGLADQVPASAYSKVGSLSLPVWLLVFDRYHLYNARHVAGRRDELSRLLHAVGLSIVLTALVAYGLNTIVGRSWLILSFATAGLALAAERECVRASFNAARRRGHLLRPIAVAGSGDEAATLVAMFRDHPELGYRVVAVIADSDRVDPRLLEAGPLLDPRAKLPEQVRMVGANGVLVATTDIDLETSNRLIRSLTDSGVHVEMSSSLRDIDAARLSVRPLGRIPVVYVEPVKRTGWRAGAKRAFDMSASAAALLVTAPLWLLIGLAIKVSSAGPVLFRQERVGRRGRRFKVYKFRTMVADAEQLLLDLVADNEADGPLFKLKADPRVTRVGRFLRKCSLDELPQLLNVLKGEMSLVGPRPALPGEVTQWGPELFERLRVQPGITGMWQVNGRSNASFSEYQRWDLYYVDNWSLWRDVAIIAKTVPVVLTQKGAY